MHAHLILFLVLVVQYAAAHPLSRDLLASTLMKEVCTFSQSHYIDANFSPKQRIGGLNNPLGTSLSLAATCSSGGGLNDRPNCSGQRISPIFRGLLLNALANRAVASQVPPTSTTLPARTSLYPLPTTTQPPSHTQAESTAEGHTSIPATPHTPNEASSPVVTATVTTTATDNGDGSNSSSDPSISAPTSTDSSNSSSPSELATIIGSVVGGVVFIAMIIAFIIMWKRF